MFKRILSVLGLRSEVATDVQVRRHWRYLAKVCRTRRMKEEMSINQLARISGLTWVTVSDFELLRVKTKISTIRAIFRGLDLNLNKIIKELDGKGRGHYERV